MSLAPILPLVSAAGPVATKAIGALERLADKISFRELLSGSSDAPSAAGPSAPPVGLTNKLQAALSSVGQMISNRLSQLGIDLGQPLEFTSDGAGGARLSSGHPQAGEIEAALRADPAASNAIGKLLRQATLDRQQADSAGFLKLHESNPSLAQSQFPHLSGAGGERSVRLRLDGERFIPVSTPE
jgi:hypothetical protein